MATTTTDDRDIVNRCCICRYSMLPNGDRLSHNPVSELAWQNIATVFSVSDGRCNVCEPSERAQFEADAAAIRALGSWKTADAAPALLTLAQNAANPTDRMLCLRSYLGLAGHAELPAEERLSMCKQAAGLLKSSQEKKMLMGTLGGIQSLSAVNVLLPYLNDAEVKNEASAGVLAIAGNLLQGRNGPKLAPKLVEPLKKVQQTKASAALTKRASDLLQQAQAGRK